MSIVMQVFVDGRKMLSPSQWARALVEHGFAVELDEDFDVASFSGFLPCKYRGVEAGFEYAYEELGPPEELDEHVRAAIGDRDRVVSFVTHSDMRGLMTSVLSAGVLCALTDGVLWDTEADELTPAAGALDWARESEAAIAPEL